MRFFVWSVSFHYTIRGDMPCTAPMFDEKIRPSQGTGIGTHDGRTALAPLLSGGILGAIDALADEMRNSFSCMTVAKQQQ